MPALPALIPRYTIRDLELWEDRWELIEGVPHAMSPAPAYPHQFAAHRLAVLLDDALAECPECWVVAAGNWRISEDTVVIPDLLVGCGTPPPEGGYLDEPPALIVETLSPSMEMKERTVKHALFAREGVAHYIIVDVARSTLEAFVLDGDEYERVFSGSEGDLVLDLGGYEVWLDVARIWERSLSDCVPTLPFYADRQRGHSAGAPRSALASGPDVTAPSPSWTPSTAPTSSLTSTP